MKTWIKLYIEILSDPKMGRMSDKQFRRTIELFLIAGKEDNNGILPSLDDIAWMLHASKKEVQTLLRDLKAVGIVSEIGSEKYEITNFSERQNSEMTRSEINKRYYEKQKAKSENKTDTSLNQVLQTSENESEFQTKSKIKFSKNSSEIHTVEEEVEIDKEEDKELREVKESVLKDAPAKKTPAKQKPEKHTYGSFGNVLLTDAEAESLRKKFTDADNRIEYFSTKKKAKGYVYKSDYAAILAWADDDAEKKKAKPAQTAQPKPQTQPEDWMAIADRIMAQDAVMGGLQ